MTSWRKLLRLLSFDEDGERDWRRQNDGDSPLYEYIHLQDTGKLVDVFNSKCVNIAEALNSIIRDEIVRFLYNGGKGQVVRSKCNAFVPQRSVSVLDEIHSVACEFMQLFVL